MDSKLVVEQMSGRWQIKHPDMRRLAARGARGAARLRRSRYAWIPREQNKHADRLANEAMDAAAQGRPWQRRSLPADHAIPADRCEPRRSLGRAAKDRRPWGRPPCPRPGRRSPATSVSRRRSCSLVTAAPRRPSAALLRAGRRRPAPLARRRGGRRLSRRRSPRPGHRRCGDGGGVPGGRRRRQPAAARPGHGEGGRRSARPRRAHRRRLGRDGVRRLGGAHLRRARAARLRTPRRRGTATRRWHRRRRVLRRSRRPGGPGPRGGCARLMPVHGPCRDSMAAPSGFVVRNALDAGRATLWRLRVTPGALTADPVTGRTAVSRW